MNSAILATFSDVIGFLAQSFKLTAVFPAFIFALLNEWLLLPHLPQRGLVVELVALDLSGQLVIAAAFALLLGYTLTIVNISLIRLFEGYGWRETRYGRGLTELQEARRQMLMRRILSLENEISQKISEIEKEFARYETGDPQREFLYQQRKGWEKKLTVERTLYEQQIRDYFPAVTPILPTALGNTIAAFEDYSWIRYGIDAVVLWPRLLPTLTEGNYAVYVEREKAGLDFTLNMCVLLLLLGLEMIYVGLIFGRDCAVWLIASPLTAENKSHN